MNIVIGKIGKSILFDRNKWGAIGGDNEAPIFYEMLAHNNPNDNFYIIGRSDFSSIKSSLKNRINKNNNIFDVFENDLEYKKNNYERNKEFYKGKYTDGDLVQYTNAYQLVEMMENHIIPSLPKIDCGIIFSGPDATTNLPGVVKAKDKTQIANPLISLIGYVGPIYTFLNKTKIPYAIICTDPRYFPGRGNDLLNPAKVCLSQFTKEVVHTSYTDLKNSDVRVKTKIPMKYSGVETIFLLDKQKGFDDTPISLDSFFEEHDDSKDKNIKFMIVLNEGRPSRYNMLKEFILDHVKDVDIYGKWAHPDALKDPRFKGPRKFNDLQQMLPKVKYTFIIPIKKGWVTAKFWEMAHYGIIPFMHPTYDEQNNLQAPAFLKVKNAEELYKRIEFLEKNPDKYDMLRRQLDKMLKEEYYSGKYLNDLTMNTLKEITKE